MRSHSVLAGLCICAMSVTAVVIRAQDPLPPLSYVCPMPQDADVIEDKPGTCPKCGMRLQPIRLTAVWTCPIHAAVIQDRAGTCPINGRRLIQVTMAESWTCSGDVKPALQPGRCPDGSPRKRTFSARPHGNHNPQHGGEFFMAPDNWHHLEGTYPSAGLFRLYLYDDYTKPLTADKVKPIAGHVTTADGHDVPLRRAGRLLEASIGSTPFPVVLHARVKFDAQAPENLFDFTFPSYSKDGPPAPTVPSAPMGTPTPTGIKLGLNAADIPADIPQLLQELQKRADQIRALIQEGQFGTVYVPAFEAKDLALALVDRAGQTVEGHELVDAAVGQLVRDTYLLDAYGDLGNGRRITAAYQEFAAAIDRIEQAYPKHPR
jgi:hypothetical protein